MELIVYSSFWCPDCRTAKPLPGPTQHPLQRYRCRNHAGAIEEIVKRTGKRAVPQFVIDGEWVQPYVPGQGFLYEAMAKRLGVAER